jgi:hypothetical protein
MAIAATLSALVLFAGRRNIKETVEAGGQALAAAH